MIAYYQVKFTYKDGKDMNVNMVPDKLKRFFDTLNTKQIFWYGDDEENPETGFWTNLDDIRFIQIHAVKGEEKDEKDEKNSVKIELDKGNKIISPKEASKS